MGNQSKVTAQGQISVPAEVRRRLGVGPGSVLEWHERDGEFVVRRGSKYTFAEIHAALFAGGVSAGRAKRPRRPIATRPGILTHIRKRHARR